MFESRVNLSCVVVGSLLRSVEVRLNICSKLVRNIIYLQNTSVFLISKHTPLMFRGTAGSHDQHSCLKINLCFGPSYYILKFRHAVFPHPKCTEMPVQALRFPGRCDSQISRQSAYESGKDVSITRRENARG
jgi:hypothetical protein